MKQTVTGLLARWIKGYFRVKTITDLVLEYLSILTIIMIIYAIVSLIDSCVR